MTDKSYVSMERHVCIVCAKMFDTGSILLDRRLKDSLERFTITGNSLCPDDKKKFDEGYVALVGVDPEQSNVDADAKIIKPQDAYRTGEIAHVRRSAYAGIFNVPIADKCAMVFCDPQVIKILARMQEESDGNAHQS